MGFIYLFLAGRGQTAAITKLPPDVAPWPGNCASRCPGSCKVLGTRLDPGNGNAGHGPGAPAGSVGPREGGQGTAGPWGIGGSRDWEPGATQHLHLDSPGPSLSTGQFSRCHLSCGPDKVTAVPQPHPTLPTPGQPRWTLYLGGPPAPRPAPGWAPATDTNSKVGFTCLCLSYELVHLYLLL